MSVFANEDEFLKIQQRGLCLQQAINQSFEKKFSGLSKAKPVYGAKTSDAAGAGSQSKPPLVPKEEPNSDTTGAKACNFDTFYYAKNDPWVKIDSSVCQKS